MDFQTKKWWVFIGLSVLWIAAAAFNIPALNEAATKISAAAGAWGLLDTVTKFAKKKEG